MEQVYSLFLKKPREPDEVNSYRRPGDEVANE